MIVRLGEERANLIGQADGVILHITYQNAAVASASSRLAEQNAMSKTTTTARIRSDGADVEVLPEGTQRPFPNTPMRQMTEAQIAAAAEADRTPGQ